MAEEPNQFKHSLLRMLQNGEFQESCSADQCTKIAFHEETIYQVRLSRHRIVVTEHEVEVIRRYRHGQWVRMRPTVICRGRIVMDRATGKIVESPTLGVLKTAASPRRRGNGTQKRLSLALTT